MKIVNDHPQFCSVRILFTNATLPYMSHIIDVRLSSVRWKDIIHVHFTDPVILAA